MVTEAYIKAGGLEATGMDIDKFAEMYFKKLIEKRKKEKKKLAMGGIAGVL
jgi:hypothetical protein